MYRKTIVLSIIIVAALALTACGGAPAPAERVRIGVTFTTQGRDIGVGDVAEMALAEYAGDIPVEMAWFAEGTEEDPFGWFDTEIERTAMEQAIADPEVVVIVGGSNTEMLQVGIPIANEAGLAYVGSGASWAGLTRPGYGPGEPGIYYPSGVRTFFRLCSRDDVLARMTVDFLIEELEPQSVYIVSNGQAWIHGLMGQIELAALDADLDVLAYEDIVETTATQEEIEALAARIADAEPDVLITGQLLPLLYAVRALDPDLPIAGAALTGATVTDPPEGQSLADLEGIYYLETYPQPQLLGTEAAAAFIENYEARYGELDYSLAGQFVGIYEIFRVGLTAIEQADAPTREGVLESLQNFGTYPGVYGDWTFTPEGDRSIAVGVFSQLQDGEWVTVSDLVTRSQE